MRHASIDEEDVLLLSIAQERVRNERSATAIRRNERICERNREFILETLRLIKGIFVILLKVSAGQG